MIRERDKAYREAHKEDLKAKKHAYYETNKDEISKKRKKKAYRASNQEKIKAQKKDLLLG